jgi:hypothetical protein
MWSLRAEEFTWETAAGVRPGTMLVLSPHHILQEEGLPPVTLLLIVGGRRKECLLKTAGVHAVNAHAQHSTARPLLGLLQQGGDCTIPHT